MNVQTNEICVEGDWLAEQALCEWASPQLNFRSVLNAHTARRKEGARAGAIPNARPQGKPGLAQSKADLEHSGEGKWTRLPQE